MSFPKLLFVDDEPNIRLTLPAILRMHGFHVTATATVREALLAMQSQKFDVLLTDLNIGQPGDGFTVVSAMRRTQPDAITIILTGYPAFETALEAIRSQVDDYVVKPADVDELVRMIERKLDSGTHDPRHVDVRRMSVILRESTEIICNRWVADMRSNPEFAKLNEAEQCVFVRKLIEEVAEMLDEHPGTLCPTGLDAARQYGSVRRQQGASIALMLEEVRALRNSIYMSIQENLLAINVSRVIGEMIQISECLDRQTRVSVEAYLQGSGEATPVRVS